MAQTYDRLMTSRCRLISTNPWYGIMASQMKWRKSEKTPTMGVSMSADGLITCSWNEKFCADKTVPQLMAVIQHEIEHIVRLHLVRWYGREPRPFNIAADMIVNGDKNRPNIQNLPDQCVYYQHPERDRTTEEVYEWFMKKMPKINIQCPMCKGSGKAKKDGDQDGGGGGESDKDKEGKDKEGQGGGKDKKDKDKKDQKGGGGGDKKEDKDGDSCDGDAKCPMCNGEGSKEGKVWVDDHSMWRDSTISEDQARQLVREMTDEATKHAGTIPGHLEQALKELEKPRVRWRDHLKRYVGKNVGMRRKTYARRNRRIDRFGVPGVSAHGSTKLTVAVDTSGSVSDKMLQQFFGELETMAHKFKITLIQFDHEIQDVAKYRRGDWKKIGVKGRGGTSFINCIEGMKEKCIVGKVNIILTDGYAPWPEEQPFPVLWCVMGDNDERPPWGDYIRIKDVN